MISKGGVPLTNGNDMREWDSMQSKTAGERNIEPAKSDILGEHWMTVDAIDKVRALALTMNPPRMCSCINDESSEDLL
jgi:hypothetical protein